MRLIQAGKAVLGSREDDTEAHDNERPRFEARLDAYYLGLYCVTNLQYAAFLNAAGPSKADLKRWVRLMDCHLVQAEAEYGVDREEYGDHPVVQVTWFGAEAYCEWAGLRLPTELEWEKGARGPQGLVYPWGDDWDPGMCRWAGNRESGRTCAVDHYPKGASAYGMFNTAGNVWEWCADWYDPDVYYRYASGDLTPPARGWDKVQRGGSWDRGDPWVFRSAYRDGNGVPAETSNDLGFRCARSA